MLRWLWAILSRISSAAFMLLLVWKGRRLPASRAKGTAMGKVFKGSCTVAFAFYALWLGWDSFGPQKPQVLSERKEMAAETIPQVVEDLQAKRGELRTVALLHLVNDPTDYVTNELRMVLGDSGVLHVHGRTFRENLRELLRLEHPARADHDTAMAAARAQGVDGVLFGTVHAFEVSPAGSRFDLDLKLMDARTGKIVFDKRYERGTQVATTTSEPELIRQMKKVHWIHRMIGWLVIVLLLPVFTIAFLRSMVRRRSNATNAFTLGVYTAADALLAYLFLGVGLTSTVSMVLLAALVVGALLYNATMMSFALRLET